MSGSCLRNHNRGIEVALRVAARADATGTRPMSSQRMKTRSALLTVLAAALAATVLPVPSALAGDDVVRLAQAREIEVYYDEYGRRVIADAYTGQILSIERPRAGELDRRATGSVPRYRRAPVYVDPDDEPYYLDEEEPQYRRRGAALDEYDDYDPAYPGDEAELQPRDRYGFPPAPAAPPGVDQPVVRQPLPEPGQPSAALPPPVADEPQLSPSNPSDTPTISKKSDFKVAQLQVLLDRAGVSPGVIDGHMGGNVEKALRGYAELTGVKLTLLDFATIESELAARGGDAFVDYTITPEDAAGPYVASIPADYGQKAQLEAMSYTSTLEMLAERFHMSEAYLKELNPDVNFNRPGTVLKVANPGGNVLRPVASIVADKGREQVRAYDAAGRLVVSYPATIGSTDTPSPTGTVTVERIAINPEYTYNPKINFKQGENDKVLRIPPGPNGPVGTVWIALSKPTYGIHGTPEPSKIGKTNSHGCVRLTNWDAQELAKLVKQGVTVEFVE
jgi:lipoprotein-anchoring transpeptidase ErfK/SrfK